jgi:cytidylate kinase
MEHLGKALARAQHQWQARFKAAAMERREDGRLVPAAVTIAIAREEGAGGTAIGQKVTERLGWQVYDHELLQRIADEMGLRDSLLRSIDEKGQSWLTVYLQLATSEQAVSEGAYVHELTKVVLALAVHGECVIVGRGAALLLPPEKTLRIRLVAPLEQRIATVQRRHGLTRDAALRRIEETDMARDKFVRRHFHKDPTDPRNYDLVLNTARFGVDKSAELIEKALRGMERG